MYKIFRLMFYVLCFNMQEKEDIVIVVLYFAAKKLPKNEQSGSASTSGQGRRLVESEGQKAATGNCCK